MLRRYTTAQAAEKLGLDVSEVQFLLLHFREFITARQGVDAPVSLTDEDVLLLQRVYTMVQDENKDPSVIRGLLRAELSGVHSSGKCQGGILAFGSGRAGSGKSSIVWNLAAVLASRGFRPTVFDGAVGQGGISQLLLSAGRIPEESEDWEIHFHSGVRLVRGEKFLTQPGYINGSDFEESAEHSLEAIDAGSDFLLIDAGESRSDGALRYAMVADETIVVTDPDVGRNADCFAVIRMLKDVDPEARIGLIINKARGLEEAREAYSRINGAARKMGIEELGSIGWVSEDEALHQYMLEGIPVTEALPTSPSARCLGRVADVLAHRLTPVRRNSHGGLVAVMGALRASLDRGRPVLPGGEAS